MRCAVAASCVLHPVVPARLERREGDETETNANEECSPPIIALLLSFVGVFRVLLVSDAKKRPMESRCDDDDKGDGRFSFIGKNPKHLDQKKEKIEINKNGIFFARPNKLREEIFRASERCSRRRRRRRRFRRRRLDDDDDA